MSIWVPDGWFARLSPDGTRVAAGSEIITVDGVVVGPGTTAVWLNDYVVLYTRQPDPAAPGAYPDDGLLMAYNAISRERIEVPGHYTGFDPSSLCVDGRGRWAICRFRTITTSEGRTVTEAFRPTWAGTDLCWCVDLGLSADLYREGRLIARNVSDVRGMPDGRLCYIQVDGSEQWACIDAPYRAPQSWRLQGVQEYRPQVLTLDGVEWVFSTTRDDRLLLRTGNNGVVISETATYEPDIACHADGTLRVVWAERDGLHDIRLTPPLTQTDLRVAEVAPWPPGAGWRERSDVAEIDMVDYWLGGDWSRGAMHVPTDTVTYTHPFQSHVGPGYVQHTKFDPPDTRAATWTVSDAGIGLAHDGTNELRAGYRFVNPGTTDTAPIYPRRMRVGPQHRHVVPVEILNLDTPNEAPRRVQFAGWVERMWENTAPIGGIPAGTLHAEIMFEPAWGEDSGWRERNLCISGGGSWYWDSHRKSPNAVPHMRWIGSITTPRVADPPVQYADRLPVLAPVISPPFPEPEPMPTLPTHFALQHISTGLYLAVEPSGIVAVDRPLAGLYETLSRHDGVHGGVALSSRYMGKFLRAADPGEGADLTIAATADKADTYESFVAVPLSSDTVALLTFHGGVWQRSEAGGLVGRLGPLDQHAWRVVPMPAPPTPTPDPGDPLPDPAPSRVLPVVVDERILRTTDGTALDWREASFFMVLARWLGQNGGSPQQMIDAFRAWRAMGINTLRGFASIGHPDFWQSRGWLLTPRTPGIYKGLHDCTVAAAAEGIRMRWTLLADTGDVFRDTADVRAHIVACMDALRGLPCVIEICNEPTMNGYGSGWAQELADLGRSLDESAVIALGPEHGATGHLATADIPPADVVFFHAERVLNEGGWAWVRRLGEYGVVKDGRRPVISGEPVNAGDEGAPGDYLRDPAIWFAYGAISRLVVSHGYAPTFHYHDGLFAEMPNEATFRCLQAFIAGCNAVPLDVRGWAWCNGHHAEAPWRGYYQEDTPLDDRPVRIYGRRSGREYIGVSLREPKGWTWRDLRYPVERVSRMDGERFDCSVWKS